MFAIVTTDGRTAINGFNQPRIYATYDAAETDRLETPELHDATVMAAYLVGGSELFTASTLNETIDRLKAELETLNDKLEVTDRRFRAAANEAEELKTTIREFLDDAVEQGYDRGDSYHTDLLADAVDYSFFEDRTVTLTIEVTLKAKRGAYLNADSFEVEVTECDEEIDQITDWTIERVSE